MGKVASLTIQQWGNSLAVRIPSAVARSAKLTVGQPVEIESTETGLAVKCIGTRKLSLSQKLALYDPALHGGEVMADVPVGAERF